MLLGGWDVGSIRMGWLTTAGVLAVVVPSLYMYTAAVVSSRFPALRNKRICILIAHPDDEAMFFSPAVMALAKPETGNHVKILCLSSGRHPHHSLLLCPFSPRMLRVMVADEPLLVRILHHEQATPTDSGKLGRKSWQSPV
jgi:hypothetical protein